MNKSEPAHEVRIIKSKIDGVFSSDDGSGGSGSQMENDGLIK
jgi:hypothetical protein